MPIENLANRAPAEDYIHLARLTMDEVGADIEEHGHVAVTPENRTQDPSTAKGCLVNALDEAVSFVATGEAKGVEMGNKPDTPTMAGNDSDTTKDLLMEAVDAVAMDARHTATIESIKEKDSRENEIGAAGTSMDDTDKKWLKQKNDAMKPELPKSLGGMSKTEDDDMVYLEYTFTIDPTTYRSNNYQPIANAAEAGKNKSVSAEGTKETEQPEDAEQIEVAEVEEKDTEDEAPEKVALDYAACYDGSSFLCYDEVDGIDYTKIAMDASPKKANIKPSCKTTFAQCRAENPLYCRFHGPKLLEKDIKQALTALLGKNGCTISVTKDKDSKNPMTFRLTVGCVPAMKEKIEDMVHKFMTQNPGIKSAEGWKDLGEKGGKIMETEEFEMDILQADKPPKASDWALQAKYDTEKAKEAGKKQAVVGETPSNIEAIAKGEKPPMKDKPKKKPVSKTDEGSAGSGEEVTTTPDETPGITNNDIEAAEAEASAKKETEVTEREQFNKHTGHKAPAKPKATVEVDYQKQFSDLADEAIEKKLFDYPDFKARYDKIYNSDEEMDRKIERLSALVKEFSEKKESGREEGGTSTYDKDFGEAETAMKSLMDGSANYLSMGYMDVDDAHSGLITAFNDIKYTKGNIEAIQKSISALDEEGGMSVSSVVKKKALLDGLKKFADYWPQAMKNFNNAKDAMISAMSEAKRFDVDKMKAEAAAKVEAIVVGVANYLFPGGKTEGVGSVAELLDLKESEINEFASKNGMNNEVLYTHKNHNDLFKTYKATVKASNEFDMAIKQFKEAIDEVNGKDGKESLDAATKDISAKAEKLTISYMDYKLAIVKMKTGIENWIKMQRILAKQDSKAPESPKHRSNLKDGGGEHRQGKASTPKKKFYTKEMLDSMSLKDKLTAAIAIAKKKLGADPSNEGLKEKLAKWEKQLASLS